MGYGTLGVDELVRTANQNILQFGEERLFEYVEEFLTSNERLFQDAASLYMEPTVERIMGYGGASGMVMVETDEWGRVAPSKPTMGGNIGIPLKYYQVGWQANRRWMENHTVGELAAIVEDAALVDTQKRQAELKNALLGSSNYSFVDYQMDRYTLSVKRLANADGFALPPDPYGNTFNGATHTHYLARVSTLAASDIDALVNTVAEHYNRGSVMLMINQADEAAIRALNATTSQFLAIQPVTTELNASAAQATGELDVTQINNRRIGYWGNQGAAIWVKPWIPASYFLAVMINNGSKALAYRTRRPGSGGLRIAADNEQFPLRAQVMEAEYGFGVQDRTSAAVLYIGGTSYVSPSF